MAREQESLFAVLQNSGARGGGPVSGYPVARLRLRLHGSGKILIRDSIEKEYYVAMKALEARAGNLGMMVRSVDVGHLKKILRDRAFLYASCLDRGIRAGSDNPKVSVEGYSIACVREGMKIADQIDREAWAELGAKNVSPAMRALCVHLGHVPFDKMYDFLLGDPGSISASEVRVMDPYKVKQCLMHPYE